MYLPKQKKNLYTIGKLLRKEKGLRKIDHQGHVAQMPPQLKQYVDQLLMKGLAVKNLAFASFKTKNGLPYPGLIAVKPIATNTIMVRIPVDCLLTTRSAFLSDIQFIFEQNPKFFAKRFTSDWQDHILLAYLLYENQKGSKSQWYNLIRNLPKQIDYAIFWNDQQINFLEDDFMKIGIINERQKFHKQCVEFQLICSRYPKYFQKDTYTEQNIRWIHTHLVTRCFGKYFQYTTMVPFAQLFNHQCTDVYYTMAYKPGNPYDTKEQFYDQKQLEQQQMKCIDTTNGTYDADDYRESCQFLQIDEKLIIQAQRQLKPKDQISNDILKDIKAIKSYLITFISFSDNVSFKFLCQTYDQLRDIYLIEASAAQRQKLKQIHLNNIKYLTAVKAFYNRLGKSVYSYSLGQKKKVKSQTQQDLPKQNQLYFNKDWPKDKFDEFLMICSTKDQFEQGAQVYFCYGRLPNKLLLIRYGIALQHNKYDHIFLRIDIYQQLLKHKMILDTVNEIEMNKFKRFKLKRTKFSIQLITYTRSQYWNYNQNLQLIFNVIDLARQQKALMDFIDLIQSKLNTYKNTLQQNQKILYHKDINYHQYFAVVYKLQQQRILFGQIDMAKYAIYIIGQLKKGMKLKDVLINQVIPQNLTKQIMMEGYFNSYKL